MASDKIESEAQTRGVSAPTARVTIQASDRSLDIAAHDQGVLTFFHRIGTGISTETHITVQELADALEILGIKLPKASKEARDQADE